MQFCASTALAARGLVKVLGALCKQNNVCRGTSSQYSNVQLVFALSERQMAAAVKLFPQGHPATCSVVAARIYELAHDLLLGSALHDEDVNSTIARVLRVEYIDPSGQTTC